MIIIINGILHKINTCLYHIKITKYAITTRSFLLLMPFFFDKNGYVALIDFLASQNQKVTYLKKVGDL
jgi:hypothetical protein